MSDTPISPNAAGLTLAGVALTLVAGTATLRGPTVGAVALAGVAPSLVQQLQTPDKPGVVNLLKLDSVNGVLKYWPGGTGLFSVVGAFGGATVTLQFAGPDGATMLAAGSATTLTAAGSGQFNLPPGLIQAAISSASGSTSLTAAAQALPTRVG